MRKKLCRHEESEEELNVKRDDGDEQVHRRNRADGILFQAISNDDDSSICAKVILPEVLWPVTINGHLIGFHHSVDKEGCEGRDRMHEQRK